MKALWTGVSAIAVLVAASAAFAAPGVGESPAQSTHVIRVELTDPNLVSAGGMFVSLANPVSARSFDYRGDGISVVGRWLEAPPAALTLDTHSQLSLADVAVSRDIAPGLGLDFGYGDTGLAEPFNLHTDHAGLFVSDSALSAPYGSLANGGNYSGVRIHLSDGLRLRFGIASRDSLNFATHTALSPVPEELFASLGNGFSAQTVSASAEWAFADWGSIAVNATSADEQGTVLGRVMAGPNAIANSTNTVSLGVSARVGFGDGWVTTMAFNSGMSHLDLNPGAFVSDFQSNSYGVALTKEGIFGNDAFGFSVSRPMQSNGMVFGADAFGPRPRVPMTALTSGASGATESDMQMGYVTTFLDGALALQANAGYQMNANGQKGEDGVSASAHAQFKF